MNGRMLIGEGLCVLAAVVVLLGGCSSGAPILVGFSGELSGQRTDLGIDGRNGTQLAVDEINGAGGIAGRPIVLMVRDDLGTPEGARAADQDLIDAGVVAIIGHMTSGQSVAALPIVEEAGVVLLSPTSSTVELSGRKDHFFRVNATNSVAARLLADHIYRSRDIPRLAVIYDTDNTAYSLTYRESFVQAYRALGGQVTREVPFSSTSGPDFHSLVIEAQLGEPEGLLIIAAAFDTALISQRTRLCGWHVPLFATGWAQTAALIHNGGQAVEGVEIVRIYDPNNQSQRYQSFRTQYQERFRRPPSFASAQAYEAVYFLAEALKNTGGKAQGLDQALLQVRGFVGLTGPVRMDPYGDVVRTHYLVSIRNGQFVTLVRLTPESAE